MTSPNPNRNPSHRPQIHYGSYQKVLEAEADARATEARMRWEREGTAGEGVMQVRMAEERAWSEPTTVDLFRRPDWQALAACREIGTEIFYTERGESQEAAMAVCRTCPVTEECLESALARGEKYGVWGGTSERQRRRIRKERRLTADGVQKVCEECAVVFAGLQQVRFCDSCRAERRAVQHRDAWARYEAKRRRATG